LVAASQSRFPLGQMKRSDDDDLSEDDDDDDDLDDGSLLASADDGYSADDGGHVEPVDTDALYQLIGDDDHDDTTEKKDIASEVDAQLALLRDSWDESLDYMFEDLELDPEDGGAAVKTASKTKSRQSLLKARASLTGEARMMPILSDKDGQALALGPVQETPDGGDSGGSSHGSDSSSGFDSTESEESDGLEELVRVPVRRASWVSKPVANDDDSLLRITNDDLQEASLRGDVFLVRRLIDARASVNAPMRPEDDDEFMTLLHILARKPHMPNCTSVIAEMLRSKANLNVRSSFGTTPLSFACHAKHIGAIEVLLRAKASAHPIDDYGCKAPFYAILPAWDEALCDNTDEALTVKSVELLANAGADLNDGGDEIPIVEAVTRQNIAAVEALLAAGVVAHGLHVATEKADVTIINDLIASKANPFVKDETGKTVMDIALAKGDEDIIDIIRDFIGDLQREHHEHLKTLEENRLAEEKEEQKQRAEQLEETPAGQAKKKMNYDVHMVASEKTSWDSPLAREVQSLARKVNKNKIFQAVMFQFLLIALFIADIWVMFDIENPDALDWLLVVILVGFVTEFLVQLAAHRKSYTFSFFFWMDLLGILSVPLDHSLVLNNIPSGLGNNNTVVMRAARMAKLGARAGRFTKLVKLLRFLPGMQETNTVGTAKVISATLNMALSTRVSCLIIVMVMVLPLFSLTTYPENDFSMMMWVDWLSDTAGEEPTYIDSVISEMEKFYADASYFPFEVNLDYRNGSVETRNLGRQKPNRKVSRSLLEASNGVSQTSVAFNFGRPHQIDAICNCTLIVTIMLLMIFSALFMSNVVKTIVLVPLEEMLQHVRTVVSNVFKSIQLAAPDRESTKEVEDEDDAEHHGADSAFADETLLLAKVLKKIAALSEITVTKSPVDAETLEGMDEADRGLVKGYSEATGQDHDVVMANTDDGHAQELAEILEFRLSEVGISWAEFESWDLDTLKLTDQASRSLCLCSTMMYRGPAVKEQAQITSSDWQACCSRFLEVCESGYNSGKAVPYHSWIHAVDVTFTLFRLLKLAATEHYFSAVDSLGLLVAAVGHDIGHPGRNNFFLVETRHELAMKYNDVSPLENMHSSTLFQILGNEKTNILSELDKAQFKDIRHVIIEAILNTDYVHHASMIKEFESLYHVNQEMFDTSDDMYQTSTTEFPAREIIDYFKGADVKKTLRNVFLHLSDISNPMKAFEISEKWAGLVLEEFCNQGDREKELGMPVQPLNDRETLNKPLSQIGFIEYFVAPLSFVMARIVPPFDFCVHMLLDNCNIWLERWVEDSAGEHSQEEEDKLRERLVALVGRSQRFS